MIVFIIVMPARCKFGVLLIIILSTTITGCNSNIFGDESVEYIMYFSDYEDPLNVTEIKYELENESIDTHSGSSWWLSCRYMNEISDTSISSKSFCMIQEEDWSDGVNVEIRLFDINSSDLNDYKPILEESMNFLTSIIYNATGAHPIETYYQVRDYIPTTTCS